MKLPLKYTGLFSQLDKPTTDSVVDSVYSYLSGKQNTIPLHDDMLPFGPQIVKVVTIPDLREKCSQDESMARMVAGDMEEMMQKAKQEMVATNPYTIESELLAKVEASKKADFGDLWTPAKQNIAESYTKEQIDTDFYDQQFSNAIKPVAEQRSVMYETVKEHLTEEWADKLQARQIEFEKQTLDRHTDNFVQELDETIKKMNQVREDLADLIPELSDLYSLVSKMGRGAGGNGNGSGDGEGDADGAGNGKSGKPKDSVQQQIMNSLFNGTYAGGGSQGHGGGHVKLKHKPFDVIQKYAKMLKGSSVERLAETLGRSGQTAPEYEDEIFMKVIYKPEYKADYAAKSDITGVRESDDLGNMLSSEKVLLCDELLESVFYKKFVEKKLHTYEYRGRHLAHREEHQEDKRQKVKEDPKGPFIICADTSGSMTFDGGLPEMVAKVLTYGIVKIALKEKRKVYLIIFSGSIECIDLSTTEDAVNGLVDFLSLSFNGGTDVEPALEESLRMLETSDYKKSDVLIVSDFIIADLGKHILTRILDAKKKKTKFHSLVIGKVANKRALAGFDTNWFYDPNLGGVINLKK